MPVAVTLIGGIETWRIHLRGSVLPNYLMNPFLLAKYTIVEKSVLLSTVV